LDAEGRLKVTIKSWKLFRASEEVTPLRFDKSDAEWSPGDNPNADWVGNGEAELRLLATDSIEAERGLEVMAQGTTYACKHVAGRCRTANCEWLCSLPKGWAGEGPETEVAIRLGEQGLERKRTYRVSAASPDIRIGMNASELLAGEELKFCATLESDGGVPITRWGIEETKLLQDGLEIPMEWRQETQGTEPLEVCWRAVLPLTAPLGALRQNAAQLKISLAVSNMARNTFDFREEMPLRLTRIACQTEAVNERGYVTQPLVYANGRLLFASSGWKDEDPGVAAAPENNSLYLYHPDCEAAGELYTGSIQGPMVALGNTGQVAIAIVAGGPRGGNARLAVVNTTRTPMDFHYSEAEMDCSNLLSYYYGEPRCSNLALFATPPIFTRGLALVRIGSGLPNPSNWRLVAPGTPATSGAVLFAFAPEKTNTCLRCQASPPGALNSPVHLTPIQVGSGENFVVRSWTQHIAYWQIYPETTYQVIFGDNIPPPRQESGSFGALLAPTGIATANQTAGTRNIWLSGQNTNGPTLQRWESWRNEVLVDVQTGYATSPAAVDANGRPYVVVQTGPHAYELRRFGAQARKDEAPESIEAFPAGVSWPVGSPILGEPMDGNTPAEVYVVTTDGSVLAFRADTLKHLWTLRLDMSISDAAQPVLVDNTLWVVSKRGELHGLRVASKGLNQRAHWAKAFRDNCNSSAQISRPTPANASNVMLNCF